jgi:hypothetical protein
MGFADMLGHVAPTGLWRRAAFAIAARFFARVPAGSILMTHLHASNNAFALTFRIGELVLPLILGQQVSQYQNQNHLLAKIPGTEIVSVGNLL